MRRCIPCRAKKLGIVHQKGKPTIEFYKNGKPQYYCYGIEDKRYDEPLDVCKECPNFVNGEQCEKDFNSKEEV